MPFPDRTLSGPHWSLWLPSRPDLDFRSAGGANVRCAKSGVYQFGMRPSLSHADTRREDAYKNRIPCPALARDSMPLDDETDEQKLARRPLCHSTLSACNELSSFQLSLLDPDLCADYASGADIVRRHTGDVYSISSNPHFEIESPFATTEVYVNMQTSTGHASGRDVSGWRRGLAARVVVGDFEGGELLFHELELRI
jgi:hypothetical protein